MKIAFYGYFHGQTGTTGNMIAIGTYLSQIRNKKVLLVSTHFIKNDLEGALLKRPEQKVSERVFRDIGLDGLIRSYKVGTLPKECFSEYCIEIMKNLYLLPGTVMANPTAFAKEEETVRALLALGETQFDMVLVDLSPGDNNLSKKVVEEADLVVLNVCQNMGVWTQTFADYPKDLMDKTFVLFGLYDKKSLYRMKNFCRAQKELQMQRAGAVCYETQYRDAISGGTAAETVKKHLFLEAQGDFSKELIRTVSCILNLLQGEEKKGD